MIDFIIRLLNQPTGITLGFIGIAVTYIATGIFADAPRGQDNIVKGAFYIAGIFYLFLAYLCQTKGTTIKVDAGQVLAYLGIGAGLICTAWAAPSHNLVAWLVFAIGMGFELVGFLLVHHAGLI